MTTPKLAILCMLAFTLSPTAGCSGDAEKAVLMRKSCLSQLGRAYHAYDAKHGRSPSGSAELATYIEENAEGELAKETAKRVREGDIVVFWDAVLKEDGDENELYVLGFEAAVPRAGGYIVTAGGSVELVNWEKFGEYKELPTAAPVSTPTP